VDVGGGKVFVRLLRELALDYLRDFFSEDVFVKAEIGLIENKHVWRITLITPDGVTTFHVQLAEGQDLYSRETCAEVVQRVRWYIESRKG
jgi:hypothetical protein